MINPTVGRVVWYYPGDDNIAGFNHSGIPLAAIIAYVHSDTMVNLAVFDASGSNYPEVGVPLYQGEGEKPENRFAEWMPYQIGQAKKHASEAPETD